MEFFKVFLLFAAVKCVRCAWIKRLEFKTNDFTELLKKSTGFFDEVYNKLEVTCKENTLLSLNYSGTTGIAVPKAANNLKGMIYEFMRESINHVGRHLMEFCDLALRLINNNNYTNIRETLSFPDDCVYCFVTAAYDSGLPVEMLFDIFFFSRIFSQYNEIQPHHLKTIFSWFLKTFTFRFDRDHVHPQLPPNTGVNGIVQRIHRIKQEITNFSKTFCTRWRPFVTNGFLSKTVLEEVQNESSFVRHVFLNERCVINGDILDNEKTAGWWEDYPKAVIRWIFIWRCKEILESQEYGLKEYERSVNPNKVVMRSEPEKIYRDQFTLAELKELLKSNNYFENVLKYYNVVSEIMLMAAIKEGYKTMTGMKLVLRWSCSDVNDNTVDTVRELRPKLSAFISIFDEFVVHTEHKKRMDVVKKYPEKLAFDYKFFSLMILTGHVRDDDHRKEILCQKILKWFAKNSLLKNNDHVYPVGDPISVIKFKRYYFDEPLLHVRQLYRFGYAYGGF